jgi:DNA replication and repair protein RecF
MELELELVNFRNFKNNSFKLKTPTIIIGPNGIGKTNIIESIYLISTTSSFKKSKTNNFIGVEEDFAKITINQKNNQYQLRFLDGGRASKEAYLNERKVSLSDLIGELPTAIFAPETLHLIKGSPSLRRSFLNVSLVQIDKSYLEKLIRYNKVKEERNKLLDLITSGKADRDELEFWDKDMVKTGSYLIEKRLNYLRFLNENIQEIYNHISREDHKLEIAYQTNAAPLKKIYNQDNKIEDHYSKVLAESLKIDLRYTTSTKGPHRDDFNIILDDKPIEGVGSQGEIRSLAFGLKLLEKKYLEKNLDTKPLFLLDDPLSELDDFRAKYLLDRIKKDQVIITALKEELRGIKKQIENFQIINLEDEKN